VIADVHLQIYERFSMGPRTKPARYYAEDDAGVSAPIFVGAAAGVSRQGSAGDDGTPRCVPSPDFRVCEPGRRDNRKIATCTVQANRCDVDRD
jgi:hypothetical protein